MDWFIILGILAVMFFSGFSYGVSFGQRSEKEKAVEVVNEILFAYINKDVECPHDFEVRAMQKANDYLYHGFNVLRAPMSEDAIKELEQRGNIYEADK